MMTFLVFGHGWWWLKEAREGGNLREYIHTLTDRCKNKNVYVYHVPNKKCVYYIVQFFGISFVFL